MIERRLPLPFSAYHTTIPSTRSEAGKFRGLVGCAPTFDASHPDYYEFLCEELRESRAAAKRDAAALLHQLRESLHGEQDWAVANGRQLARLDGNITAG